MATRVREFDWSTTPLGPREGWPPYLATTVHSLLRSPLPMALLWGDEGHLVYNQGYALISGARHPGSLGRSVLEMWPEAADFNRRVLDAGLRGESLSFQQQPLTLYRNGTREEAWMDLFYMPLLDAQGRPVGVLAVLTENTSSVLEERRRQRAEAELREANERIQLALEAGAVIGLWAWDVVHDRFTADTRFARRSTLSPEELAVGVPMAKVVQSIHPEDRARAEANLSQALERGGTSRAEFRVRQPDGSWLWIEANGHVERDAQGRAVRFPGVVLDIDARRKSEQRRAFLLAFSDRLRTLSRPRDILAVATEMLGQELSLHRVAYAEVDAEAATVTPLAEWGEGSALLEEMDAASIAELARGRTVARDGQCPAGRAVLMVPLLRARRLRAVLCLHHPRARPWPPEDIALAEDVASRTTEAVDRARVEAESRALNATLEQHVAFQTQDRNRLWALSQAPFLITDREGRWLSISPAWTELLGWSEKELLGRDVSWLVHPEDRVQTPGELETLSTQGGNLRLVNRLRHQDGSYRWFSWLAVPADGLFYCMARDVTQEHAHQEELERTQEQLRQSQKMEAVGQLTGGIAHDFNNLLAGIIGALQLLGLRIRNGKLDNTQRYIDAAVTSANRAAALTHRLLAFARRQSLDVKPTDINARVAALEDLLQRTLGEKIALRLALESGLGPALTDSSQFESAVLNLVINARDAMPTGGVLTIATSQTHLDAAAAQAFEGLAPGHYVRVCVRDTGQGMPPHVVARAFEPFFTTKPMGQGTGLGLPMIHGFARQSGGHVYIESEVGQGTAVTLLLPRHAAELAPVLAGTTTTGEAPRALAGETVLVVEDEPSVRMVVMDVLSDLGYRALEAGNAPEAMPHLEGPARIDLLVTDVGLPGMNGRQLAEVARQKRPGLKVLFITGYAEGAAVRGGFLAEGMEMITKPFAIEVLAERLRAILNPD
ncbi:PAS domain-containing protein [Melittangium boletus]|uniref:PAS domain-containing protein n=1 Tax=Melittangium boletus TaxID=83453 RepID=UPI003DA30898